eukprot:SAG25_NODE_255_length_10943_cov_46.952047_9_plen_44_part_00
MWHARAAGGAGGASAAWLLIGPLPLGRGAWGDDVVAANRCGGR